MVIITAAGPGIEPFLIPNFSQRIDKITPVRVKLWTKEKVMLEISIGSSTIWAAVHTIVDPAVAVSTRPVANTSFQQ